VIHRDIKPANLLLDNKGVVKILDMGLARIEGDTGAQAEITNTGAVMGTIDYMAPEQARNTKTADARSDIYSLGISLWYLLVAKPAYNGQTLTERLLAHQSDPIPSLCAARNDVPAALDAVFQKLVAKRPADRYQTMTTVIEALEGALRGETAAAPSLPIARSDDSKFSEFLAGLANTDAGSGGTAPHKTAVPSGIVTDVTEEFQHTQSSTAPEAATDALGLTPFARRSTAVRRPASRHQWWADRRVQLGGGTALVVVALMAIAMSSRPAANVPAPSAAEVVTTPPSPPAVGQGPVNSRQNQLDTMRWLLSNGAMLTGKVNGENVVVNPGDPLPSKEFVVDAISLTKASALTVEDLDRLKVFPGRLWLNAPPHLVEAKSAAVLGRLSNLGAVELGNDDPLTRATGEAFGTSAIAGLHIGARRIEPGGLAAFKQMPLLEYVFIGQCTITPTTLAELSQWPHLQRLTIEGAMTDEHLAALTLPNLAQLALGETEVTSAGLADFQRRHPGAKIVDGTGTSLAVAASAEDYALNFDGDDAASAPIEFDFSQPFTIEVATQLNQRPAKDADLCLSVKGAGGGITLRALPSGEWNVVGTGGIWYGDAPFTVGQSTRFALVYNGTELRLFVDGQLVSRGKGSRSKPGEYREGGVNGARYATLSLGVDGYNGLIDEVRVSSVARYNADYTPATRLKSDPQTIALYHFDDGQGVVFADSSGHKRDGNILGATWVRAGTNVETPALEFDGVDDRVEIPALTFDVTRPLTMEFWAEPGHALPNSLVAGFAGQAAVRLRNNRWSFRVRKAGEELAEATSPQDVVWNRRTHVAGVWDRTHLRLFVDGQLQSEPVACPMIIAASSIASLGGNAGGGDAFAGRLSSVRLSQSARYAAAFTPDPRLESDAETLALYHCDEREGEVLKDSSGNNRHGQIVGATWVRPGENAAATRSYVLEFDGVDDQVQFEPLPVPGRTLTLETWVTPQEFAVDGAGMPICQFGDTSLSVNQRGFWSLDVVHSDRRFHGLSDGRARAQTIQPVHLAVVLSDADCVLYLNGKQTTRRLAPDLFGDVDAFWNQSRKAAFALGTRYLSLEGKRRFGKFRMTEFRVSSTVRYQQNFTPPESFQADSDTLALYEFQEGQGEVLRDSSGHNHHGRIIGTKWLSKNDTAPPRPISDQPTP
ncbi:MAG TPA: LamG-like jellyroll fold domain-containing protein, partial [Planctomycetaceae bacterium]|nr:LamG-like jellyroll fold domain-containing protein [Planctomycetaceae bacterium]